jgi:16S rRNA (adenine1518-N6/adenine1519-N6)-dimethyltransferase
MNKKSLGQHFLTSTAIAKRIVDAADIHPEDTVLEIGPGRGILTQFLLAKANCVIVVEKDGELVDLLREKYKKENTIEIIHGDILNPKHYTLNATYYKIVANLPYYITSRFLRLFLEEIEQKPTSMVIMIQKEVAERICAKPPHMNLLALSVQAFGEPKILFQVSKGSFLPPPEVDSAVIEIRNISNIFFTKHHISPAEFFKLPKKAFSQKRKMLRSSLKNNISEVGLPKYRSKRPQELQREDWLTMYQNTQS